VEPPASRSRATGCPSGCDWIRTRRNPDSACRARRRDLGLVVPPTRLTGVAPARGDASPPRALFLPDPPRTLTFGYDPCRCSVRAPVTLRNGRPRAGWSRGTGVATHPFRPHCPRRLARKDCWDGPSVELHRVPGPPGGRGTDRRAVSGPRVRLDGRRL